MELKEGMYVRFGIVKSYIAKIIEIDVLDDIYLDICFYNRWHEVTTCIDHRDLKKYNVKASYNIIDLIEVGDYVNGYKVSKVVIAPLLRELELEEVGYYVDSPKEIAEEDIKSIVTKEQFESLSYKVV